MNSAYIASVINSTLRSTTPILLAALHRLRIQWWCPFGLKVPVQGYMKLV